MVQEKRRALRAEKLIRLEDLKEFAENFRLPTRVPDDLLPILAKDREKQIKIQNKTEKAATAMEEGVKAKQREREKAAAAKEEEVKAGWQEKEEILDVPMVMPFWLWKMGRLCPLAELDSHP